MITIESTVRKTIEIKDADGKAIYIGSVLQNMEDGARGVVTEIGLPGTRSSIPIMMLGDIVIQTSPGCYRGTNTYSQWRHIPHNDQTVRERYNSWRLRAYHHDPYVGTTRAEGCAINGIMSLLRDDVVNHEYGPWPDHLENALEFLVSELEKKS